MKNAVRELYFLEYELEYLKIKHEGYDWELYEERMNRKVQRNYLTIDLRKVWVSNAYITIDQLAKRIDDLEMKTKWFKLKKYLEYTNGKN